MKPSTVGAYYKRILNQIILPVGTFQPPFFNATFHPAFNFGALGTFMAHELTHGFDERGRKYDANGNLRQWWGDSTVYRFKKRAECLVEQYANYSINGQKLDGVGTIGIT